MKSKLFKRAISVAVAVVMITSMFVECGFTEAVRFLTNIDDKVVTVEAEAAHATAINEFWYNGHPSINGQPNNTYHYRSGTNGKTFTSEPIPRNMKVTGATFNGVSAITVDLVSAGQTYYGREATEITKEQITYLQDEAGKVGTIGDNIVAAGSLGGASIMTAMNSLGLSESDSWGKFIAATHGYDDIDALQTDINKMFWERNMWRLSTNGQTSWCLEPTVLIGDGMNTVDPSSITGTDQRSYLLGLILSAANSFGAGSDNGYYVAAQCLVWELMEGYLNYDDLSQKETSGHYQGLIVGNGLQAKYDAIKNWVAKLRKIPSFLTGDMEYERTGNCKTYYYGATWNVDHYDIDTELILKDWNGLVLEWTWPSKGVYTFTPIDKNTLKVTASGYTTEELGATGFKDKNGDNTLVGTLTFSGSGVQDQALYTGIYDPYGGWMNIKMTGGTSLKVDKENGFPLSGNTGAKVTISGPGYDGATVYDINELEQLYVPGTYTITEIHAPTFEDPHLGYVKDASPITITIEDETDSRWYTYNSASLANTRQKGKIAIQKIDEAKTYLNHINLYAEYIDCTVCHANLLTCGHKTAEWKAALAKYTTNLVTRGVKCVLCEATFPQCGCDKAEYIAKFNELAPIDIEDTFYDGRDMRITNPLPQGDATLKGAEFEIYAEKDIILANGSVKYTAGTLVETITTNDTGLAVSSNLDLGVYRVKEKTPPTGYQFWRYKAPDTIQFVVDIVYTGDENEPVHTHYYEYGDSVIMGHLSITKVVSDDDSNDIFDNDQTSVESNIPAKKVHYAIYLKSKMTDDTNSFANTRLPDEFFIPPAFDDKAPICDIVEGEGEVIDGFHYGSYEFIDSKGNPTGEKINTTLGYPKDQDKTNAAIKSLYMVLVTNDEGKAATYDASTVAYINIPGVAGEADNDAGRSDNDMNVINSSYPLPYGTYVVRELSPPEGYDWGHIEINGVKGPYGEIVFEFTVGDECKVEVDKSPHQKTEENDHHFDVVNEIIHQRIYAYKVDNEYYIRETESVGGETIFELTPEGGLIKQANIKFKLWCWNNSSNGEYGLTYDAKDIGNTEMGYWYDYTYYDYPNEITIDTFATDDEGMFTLPTPLVYGDYAFVELNAPYGYWLPDSGNTDVEDVPKKEDGTYQDWIGYLDETTGEFVWTVDKFGNTYDTPVAAAQFTVSSPDRDIIVTVDIENEAQKGYIVLQKNGKKFTGSEEVQNGKYTETHPIFTDNMGVAGATYTIYADGDVYTGPNSEFLRYKDGEKVCEFTTDNRGIGVSIPIHLGKYKLVETKAPFGYLVDETEYTIELTYKGEEVRIYPVEQEKYDIRQEVEFEVLKEIEKQDGTFEPANGQIKFGLYADQDFVNHLDEKVIDKDDLIEVITIINGKGTSSLELPIGKYYLKEVETNKDLAMDYNKYPIEFKYTADGTAYDNPDDYAANTTGSGKGETLITIKLNEGVAIKNYRKRANIELFKSDANEPAVLKPVVTKEVWMFDYDFNDVVDTKDQALFAKFVSGSVKATEDQMEMSDMDEDGVLTQADADALAAAIADPTANKKVVIGPSKVTGQNEEVENADKAVMLEGVEFTLYDSKDVEIATLKTNKYGYAYYDKGLTIGTYKIVETKSIDGYKFDPLNPLTTTFEVTVDMYNTILTYNLTNVPKDGLYLTKKDVSTGKVIPNCKINILDADKKVIFEGVTDKNGVIFLSDMAPGVYYYQEIERPAGYILDNKPYQFEILLDGGIVKAVMTNERIPTPSDPSDPTPNLPVGVIKLYMGKGVWNPATGGLVEIETTALTSNAPTNPTQETNTIGTETLVAFGTVAALALAFIIKKRKSSNA